MKTPIKVLTLLLALIVLIFSGCADYTPVEPPPHTGAVFQQPLGKMQMATRNALTKLNFAIIRDEAIYFEAVHLKPGETVEKNNSEIVGVWLKERDGNILVLIDTVKRATSLLPVIKYQKEWEQDLLRKIKQEV